MDRDDWDARYAGSDLVWSATPNAFVVAEVTGLTPARALDLAGGEGRNAVWLAEQGWDVTCLDFSAVALDKARRLAEARGVAVRLVEADVTAWQPAEPVADLVVIAYLHLPEPARDAVLHQAGRAVVPGGVLLVVGHDASNLEGGYGGPRDPAVLATPDAIVASILRAADDELSVERSEVVERPVETDEGTRVARDHVVRVRRAAVSS